MSENKLHPSVIEFKHFINKHPKLIEDIRRSGRTWQEYYEKWALLGEEDPVWDEFKGTNTNGKAQDSKEKEGKMKEKNFELLGQLMKITENMDINKVQKQIGQLSNTITTVQELINQFQQTKDTQQTSKNTFNWYRD